MSWTDKIFRFREPDEAAVKPFLDHLEDLRWCAIKMGVTLCIAMCAAFYFRIDLIRLIQHPLMAVNPNLVASLRARGPVDSITISFQLSFYAGMVISFPFLLYFLAEFILPALTKAEKKYVLPVIGIGLGLFLGGVLACYYGLLPMTYDALFKDQQLMGWNSTWDVQTYISFTTQFVLSFGLAFELPLVVLLLVKLGVLTHAMLVKTRAVAFIIIFVLAAVITPTQDIFTLSAMGFPMYFLYEICIFIAKFMEKKPDAAQILPPAK